MGTLETIGVISNGELTTTVKTKYKDGVVAYIENGFSIGSVTVPQNAITVENFKTRSFDEVKDEYPAWDGFYVNGLQKNIATILDKIPDAAVLKPIGVFDPTEPVAKVITGLQDLFASIDSLLGISITSILISQIDVVIAEAGKITEAIANQDPEAFFEGLLAVISSAIEASGIDPSSVVSKIEEKKDSVIEKANEIIELASVEIEVELPSLEIPEFDLSFMLPGVSLDPLFATIEANGYDGIATKFIKLMTGFLAIPSQIINLIKDAISGAAEAATQAIQDLVDAITSIVTDITSAVQKMLNALIGIVWEIISQILSILDAAILEIASIVGIIYFFVKCFIVSMIGFLLGSGMITLAVGKLLEIV